MALDDCSFLMSNAGSGAGIPWLLPAGADEEGVDCTTHRFNSMAHFAGGHASFGEAITTVNNDEVPPNEQAFRDLLAAQAAISSI
jgi:hypothetical protein